MAYQSQDVDITRETFSPEKDDFKLVDGNLHEEVMKRIHNAWVEGFDESFAIFDLTVVLKQLQLWKDCFPRIKPYYVKCNNDPIVLRLLSYFGCSFDCSTKAEMDSVLSIGVRPDQIIFANTVKFPSHLQFAAKKGVMLMTFDSEQELHKIKELAPQARLLLRINTIMKGMAQYELDRKFGCTLHNARSILQAAKTIGLRVPGVSFHVGSGCDDPAPYVASVKAARKVFDVAAEEGIPMNILNIGGGFYGNTGSDIQFKEMCGPINDALDCLFPKSSGVNIISEPGRFFVESGMTLASCIIGIKEPENKKDVDLHGNEISAAVTKIQDNPHDEVKCTSEDKDMNNAYQYYLSESAYGALNRIWYEPKYDYKPIPVSERCTDGPTFMSRLWGPTCDTFDMVQDCCYLPILQPADWLLFPNVGSYSICISCTFNGIPFVPVFKIMNRKFWEELTNEEQSIK